VLSKITYISHRRRCLYSLLRKGAEHGTIRIDVSKDTKEKEEENETSQKSSA